MGAASSVPIAHGMSDATLKELDGLSDEAKHEILETLKSHKTTASEPDIAKMATSAAMLQAQGVTEDGEYDLAYVDPDTGARSAVRLWCANIEEDHVRSVEEFT